MVGARGWGKGGSGPCYLRTQVRLCKRKKFQRLGRDVKVLNTTGPHSFDEQGGKFPVHLTTVFKIV